MRESSPERRGSNPVSPPLLTALTAALVYFMLLWIAQSGILGTLSDALAELQDKTMDYVSRLEYFRAGPSNDFPPVRLVEIDDPSVAKYSPDSYVFNRGKLAVLLERLDAYNPRAVFVDLSLSYPTNEVGSGSRVSAGDQKLLGFLNTPKSYLLLLTSTVPPSQARILGLDTRMLKRPICWVSPYVLRDSDNIVRRIPRPTQNQPPPASIALFQIGAGLSSGCPRPATAEVTRKPWEIHGGIGNRMVFRSPERWNGLASFSAMQLLEGQTRAQDFRGSMVLIGRVDRESLDEHITPIGRMAGVQIHVNELMTLFSYGRNIRPLTPLLSVPIVFGVIWLSLLITPWLLGRVMSLFKKQNQATRSPLKNTLERPFMWLILFGISAWLLREHGLFLDFAFPIMSLELARSALGNQFINIFARVLRLSNYGG